VKANFFPPSLLSKFQGKIRPESESFLGGVERPKKKFLQKTGIMSKWLNPRTPARDEP
jgi:hypothetical protein